MKITATIKMANGTVSKCFDVEVREDSHIFSPELIEWVEAHEDRVSNYVWITTTTKKCLYSL